MSGAPHRSNHPSRLSGAWPLPPGPGGRPLIGNLLEYTRDQLGYLTRCAEEYGDVVRLRFFNVTTYLLNHPDHVEYVLVRNNRNFVKSRGERVSLGFLGNGLLTSEGSYWRRQRRLAQPAFHRDRISAYGRVMVERAELMASAWRPGETRDVHEEMARLTLEIVTETLFGALPTTGFGKAGVALATIARRFAGRGGVLFQVPHVIPTPGNLRFRRAVRLLDGIIYDIIRRRRASSERTGDLLSMLLEVRDEDTGEGMSDEQLRDEVLTIFVAGHETTANALSWTWYLLGGHPKVEARLLAELGEVLGDRAPAVEDLSQLRYAAAVVRESLRLYPPAWAFGREAVKDCEVGGYRVLAGTQLVVSQWITHRDERFFERAGEFRPERWMDGSMENLPRYAYFPFGGGPRLCIGRSFAEMEMVLLLAVVARKFRLRLTQGQEVTPQPSITLRPKNGVKVTLERR